jgi:hypothetical protein
MKGRNGQSLHLFMAGRKVQGLYSFNGREEGTESLFI